VWRQGWLPSRSRPMTAPRRDPDRRRIAWCNADVQQVVRAAGKADKSVTAAADPMYGNLQKLAEAYLSKERQSRKDLNNQ
jgi:hypothetical protein